MTITVDRISITLPIPPLELSKNGRADFRERAKLYRQHRGWARLAVYNELRGERPEWPDPIEIVVLWFVRSGPAPDVDNATERLAAYVDGMVDAGLIANDRQVKRYRVMFRHDANEPRVELRFERVLSGERSIA